MIKIALGVVVAVYVFHIHKALELQIEILNHIYHELMDIKDRLTDLDDESDPMTHSEGTHSERTPPLPSATKTSSHR